MPATKEPARKRVFVSNEDFVKAWTKCKCKASVAAEIGMNEAAISARANHLRKAGMKLKKFSTSRGKLDANDIKRLNAIVAKVEDADDDDELPAAATEKTCRSCKQVNKPEAVRCNRCNGLAFESARK